MFPSRASLLALLGGVAFATALPTPGAAQRVSAKDWVDRCREWGDRRTERFCEVREETIPLTGGIVRVNARPNGGVTVTGWDRTDVLVRAKVQSYGRTLERAREISRDIRLNLRDGVIDADGPSHQDREGWSVSYEIFAPQNADLELESVNGGLRVVDVRGRLNMRTTNGGITLDGVAGDVRARTSNGSVRVELTGDRWTGEGLDVQTTNGSVRLVVPEGFSAHLETGTTNGSLNLDFPVQVQGRISRRISTDLGRGGAPIRLTTTNGSVVVTRN